MKKTNDYWEIFHNELGELCFHVCDGNNHKVLMWAEGYTNSQAALKVINDRDQPSDDMFMDYYPPAENEPITVYIEVLKGKKKDKYVLLSPDNEGNDVKIKIPSVKSARKVILKSKEPVITEL